jgi:hypothetical protein
MKNYDRFYVTVFIIINIFPLSLCNKSDFKEEESVSYKFLIHLEINIVLF